MTNSLLIFLAAAATQPGANEIGMWVLGAILIVNGVAAATGLVTIFATRREVDAMEKRLTASEALRDEDMKTGSDRRAKIYEELSNQRADMLKLVEKLHERIGSHERHTSEQLHRLPSEIIATLKNTGVIK